MKHHRLRNGIKVKWADFVILIVVLAISGFLVVKDIFYDRISGETSQSKVNNSANKSIQAVVRVSGKEIAKFSVPGQWKIYDTKGRYLSTLHFDGNVAWVTDSNCPDKICEKTGKVKVGGSIICVPNRMIITVIDTTKQKKAKMKSTLRKMGGPVDGSKEIDVETW
ncbi:MAG: NusG domain II-containing protein [Fervidobacterium sp.]